MKVTLDRSEILGGQRLSSVFLTLSFRKPTWWDRSLKVIACEPVIDYLRILSVVLLTCPHQPSPTSSALSLSLNGFRSSKLNLLPFL